MTAIRRIAGCWICHAGSHWRCADRRWSKFCCCRGRAS